MKLLFQFILFPLFTYSQSFMITMHIREVREDTLIIAENKVIWRIYKDRSLDLLWNNNVLLLHNKIDKPSKELRRKIMRIKKDYPFRPNTDPNVKLQNLYTTENSEIYFVTIYINDGIMIWINRLDETFPRYFFKMINYENSN